MACAYCVQQTHKLEAPNSSWLPKPRRLNNDWNLKMGHFWPLFELLYFSKARRSEAPVSKIVRARLRVSTTQSTKAQSSSFFQEVGPKIWKMTPLQKCGKKGTQKQDFCTENSRTKVISQKQPSMVVGAGRWLRASNMELSLPSFRKLEMFL